MKLRLAAVLFINRGPCFGPTTHKKSDLFAVFGRSGAHQQPLRQPTRSQRGWIRGFLDQTSIPALRNRAQWSEIDGDLLVSLCTLLQLHGARLDDLDDPVLVIRPDDPDEALQIDVVGWGESFNLATRIGDEREQTAIDRF